MHWATVRWRQPWKAIAASPPQIVGTTLMPPLLTITLSCTRISTILASKLGCIHGMADLALPPPSPPPLFLSPSFYAALTNSEQ
eukprot:2061469-Prorocentrum_lima.AAC.1